MTQEELIEKYEDALTCAETYEEKNLFGEFLDDLRHLRV